MSIMGTSTSDVEGGESIQVLISLLPLIPTRIIPGAVYEQVGGGFSIVPDEGLEYFKKSALDYLDKEND
jgi:hypothetical protein